MRRSVQHGGPWDTVPLLATRFRTVHDPDMDRAKEPLAFGEHDTPEATDRLLRVVEVAAVLGISVRQVWKLCQRGELPAPVRIGRSTRWRESEIQDRIRGVDEGGA